jgi:hypothetical protein
MIEIDSYEQGWRDCETALANRHPAAAMYALIEAKQDAARSRKMLTCAASIASLLAGVVVVLVIRLVAR